MQPLLSPAILKVVANPFASPLDREGRPCTFVQVDPEHSGGGVRYIGCRLDRKVEKPKLMSPNMRREDRRQYPRIATTVFYDLTPVGIVHSAYHVQQIRDGALLPADEATMKLCGMKGPFEKPLTVIERDASARIAEWLANNPGLTLTPASWASQIKGAALAPRMPCTASTIEERVEAQRAGARTAEGDGLAKNEVPGGTLSEAGIGSDLPKAADAVGGIQ